jgi:H/ACA ribonucleoprotein complex subunit 4
MLFGKKKGMMKSFARRFFLAIPGVVEVDTDINKDDLVAVLTLKGEGVALVKSLMSTDEIMQKDTGICADLERVLMNKGTYPSIWKKS